MKRVNRQSLTAIFLMIFGALIILGALFWFQISSQNRSDETIQVERDIPFPDIKRVGLADAKAAFDLGTAVFIDVRDGSSYQENHIPGARSIPLDRLPQELEMLDPSQWYVLYCTWPAEESSARAAQIMIENGFQNATPILGGLAAWQNAGYPTEP